MDKQNRKPGSRPEHSRHAQRVYAFQVLYSMNFVPDEKQLRTTFKHFQEESSKNKTSKASYAWELILGVFDNLDELNRIISRYSRNWRVERIALVELTIMRLAVFEMLRRSDVPIKVAINEGIELAKAFGDENSRNFVNGILDAVAKDIKNGKLGGGSGF